MKDVPEQQVRKKPAEIQQLYMEIQQRIGELERSSPPEFKQDLRDISVKMCVVKRRWIGIVDEVRADLF